MKYNIGPTDYSLAILSLCFVAYYEMHYIKRKKWRSDKKLHYHRSFLSARVIPLILNCFFSDIPLHLSKGIQRGALITAREKETEKKKGTLSM